MKDIKPGQWAYVFLPTLPDAPGASAYHDVNGKGVHFSHCAVTTCQSLYGPAGVSPDVLHDIIETAGDEGANVFANDTKGSLHVFGIYDAVVLMHFKQPPVFA
ncbi:MAG: hypothetical protein ABIP20_13055 [Chthoniobacteraceae bacterium]